MVQFCYLRLYFGIDNVCRRLDLLQWIARIKNGLKLKPTRSTTYSNQISTNGLHQIMKVSKKVTLKAGVIQLIFSFTNKLYSQTSLIRKPQGQNRLPGLQRCPYYRGRECMMFGISGTKRTVRNREVSVL